MNKPSCLLKECTRVRNKLSAFEDGEVAAVLRSRIEAHLARCPDCRHAQENLRNLWLELEESIPPRVRPGLPQAVLLKINEQSGPGLLDWMHDFLPSPATVAAMAVIGLFIGGWMGKTVMEDPLWAVNTQEHATTLAAMDVFAPTPRGSLAEGYLALARNAPQVNQ